MSNPPLPVDGLTGIVLAGGRASRFGADKMTTLLEGRPLIQHAIEAVAAVAREVIVVAAPGGAPPIPEELGTRVRVVHDPEPFGGPLVGLGAALEAVETTAVLVAGGDMPWMVPEVLRSLAAAVVPDRPAVVLEVPDRVQPLPLALDVRAARAATALVLERGGRSLRDLLRALDATSIPALDWRGLDPAGATIMDIDRPADLRP